MRTVRVVVDWWGAKLDVTGDYDAMSNRVNVDCIRMGGADITDFFAEALKPDAKRGIMAKVDRAAHKQVYEE